jgi:hypothetical protein
MKLVITGNKKYINRMFFHLRKEHPSNVHPFGIRAKNTTTV